MTRFLLASVAVALALTCASATEVEFISPRNGMLTTDDTLVVIGQAQRGQRLHWSVRREGITESDTVTADWGNLFEIFVLLDPGVNRIRVEDSSLEVFYDPGGGEPPPEFRPQFVHAGDLALCEDCHDPRHVRLLDGGYPWVCFGCHLVISANPANASEAQDDPHFRAAVADCSRCHEPHLSADPKLLRAPVTHLCTECHPKRRDPPSTHLALQEGGCTACHDPHFSGYPASLHQRLPGLCQKCHDQGLAAGEPHPALIGGASCGTCHDPHGRGESLLVDQAGALCARCHPQITRHGHGNVLADCGSCHDPHGTREAGMLRTGAPLRCLACHEGVDRGTTRHAALGEGCQACHRPHDDDNRRRARESCAGCHDLGGNRELASLHGNLNLTAAACGLCHPPHSSEVPRLLRGTLHQPLTQGNCSSCHGGGEDRSTVIAAPAQRCRMCHDFEKTLRAGGAQLHQPLLDGKCTACHDPHLSMRPALLRFTEKKLCSACHGDRLGATSHPTTQEECRTCHDPHGGYGGANLLAPP
ncbi:MAG: cytochrome c3 family protein [Deferrisomatales bacterium]|nr:cytochrome c3 family protein [Deferrisomatales bacterium]